MGLIRQRDPLAGFPGATAGLPAAIAGLPAVIAGLPAVIAGLPAVIAGVPAVIAGVPGAIAGVPAVIPGVPAVIAGLPAVIAGVPAVIAGVPAVIAGKCLKEGALAVPSSQDRRRFAEIATLAAALLWQIYVVVSAYRHAPRFATLFAGLGGPLPFVTESFLATYRFWGLLPLLSAALIADVLRRRNPSARYFGLVLTAVLLTGFLLHAWLYEAIYAPLYTILDKIG
jgi:hypothetical protein